MSNGFLNLPKSKWWDALRQVILKDDFKDIETALLEAHGLIQVPNTVWVDATSIKVPATADSPAAVLMSGFPNILHPGAFLSGGLSDGKYRVNVADSTMDFDVAASLWGTEQVSQWYATYAKAGDEDATFTLKSMPFLRVKSQTTQTIKTGTLVTPGTGRNYGFTTDEFVGGMIYFLTGDSRGLMRTITANDLDTDTTITYSGSALTVAANDWFIILPPTNFRLIGSVFNNSSGNIVKFRRLGNAVQWLAHILLNYNAAAIVEDIQIACPLAIGSQVTLRGANSEIGYPDSVMSGTSYTGQMPNVNVASSYEAQNFFLEFCRYWVATGSDFYANSYWYPPGCGY